MLSSPLHARALSVAVLSAAFLSACASTPPSSSLLNGISAADLAAKPSSVDVNGLRAATDPVCVQFYENSIGFARASSNTQPNPFGQILAATGVSVLASVVTNGVIGGGNGVGDIAARSATSQLIFAGSSTALSGLNASRGPDKKIIAQAAEIKCPVSLG